MSPFFKHNKQPVEVPEWCSFFTEKEYLKFVEELKAYFAGQQVKFDIPKGIIHTEKEYYGHDKMGLLNVAQVCKQHKRSKYKSVIREHFETLKRSYRFNQEFDKIMHDFDSVKKYIGVRLYPVDYIPPKTKDLVLGKEIAPDIFAMLVFDLPDSVMSILKDMFDVWGRPFEEVFELGIQNIRNKYPVKISKVKSDNLSLWFAQADHFFTPNLIFELMQTGKLQGTYGSLVGMPHRHAMMIYPIENLQVTEAITAMIPAIFGMYHEGPGSLSPKLFWLYEGELIDLEYNLSETTLDFKPPKKFIEVLNQLQ